MREVLRGKRRETIRQAAYRLADCGRHPDWQAIERSLCIRYGVIETRRLLTDLAMRTELNRRCAIALAQTGTAKRA